MNNTNDKTTELLMKARKGADSAFGPKDWQAVLEALGFTVTIGKTGRTVTSFGVTVGSETLTIVKEPSYKHIVFYDLRRKLQKAGVDLTALTSAKLGLETPEVEAANKKLYQRDLTNTGTCPVCGANVKGAQSLVHHGYTRPGWGFIQGDCFAVHYPAWELSPKGAVDYLAEVARPYLARKQERLANLQSGKVTSFTREDRNTFHQTTKAVTVTAESDPYEFQQMLKSEIWNTERDIKNAVEDIADLEQRIANWKADELPEVKHAGKFNKA